MRDKNTSGMTEQINALIQDITDQLDNKFPPRPTNNKPNFPLIVIYAGDNALKARPYIAEAFASVWRSKAKAVDHLLYTDGELLRMESGSDEPQDLEYGMGQVLDELQEREDCYVDMTNLLICTIESAEDFEGAEDFRNAYNGMMEQIRETETENYRLLRFVLLDETHRGKRKSGEIRELIKNDREFRQNERIMLLSNRLRNNALVNRNPVNYYLIGSAILIADGSDGRRGTGYGIFFQGDGSAVLTAAYSRLRRPNKGIVETVLDTAVNWLKKNQQTGSSLSRNDLCERIDLSAGRIAAVERFYENHVKRSLPPAEILEFFPRKSKKMDRLTTMSFGAFQNETFGIYDSFISGMTVFDKNTMDIFRRDFRRMLRESISNSEAASSLTDANIDNIISEMQGPGISVNEKTPAGEYMREQMREFFIQKVSEICREEMQQYGKDAKAHETMLDSIILEFQNTMDTNVGDTVRDYYSDLTQRALTGSAGRDFLERYRTCGGDARLLFEAIRKFVNEMFNSEPVFSLPLEGELEKRLGEKDENYQVILQNELMNNIESRARLKTLLSLTTKNKIIMANRYEEGAKETELYSFLRGLLNDVTGDAFFDTGNRNLIETIVFYSVNRSDL